MATEATTNVASPGNNAPPPPMPASVDGGAAAADGASASAQPADLAPEPAQERPAEKPEVDFSSRFAALTKKERAIMEREKALRAQEKEVADFKKAREQAKLDPVGFLEAHGLTYDAVTQFILNDRKLTDAQRLAMLEEKLAKDDADRAKAAKEAEQREIQDTISSHKEAIKSFVDQDGDTFELTRAHDAYDLVYEVIEQHWNDTGEILPIPNAAKAVEDHLENLARERVLKLKRFQPKQETSQPTAKEPSDEAGDAPETPRPAPTLTNRAVASAPPPESDDRRGLSDEESKRRSAQMLRQMLSK